MTVAEIQRIGSPEISRQDARRAFSAYRDAVLKEHDEQRRAEYQALMRGYGAIARGRQVIDLHGVMRSAGLQNVVGLPKLAIARADAKRCFVQMDQDGSAQFGSDERASLLRANTRRRVLLPSDTFPRLHRRWDDQFGRAIVPLVPPTLRPAGDLANYHILWDAVWTPAPPVDPLLLRHLNGALYAIVAAWDLTPLEQAVLSGRL
jgi:hypothetical protein